MSLRGIDWQLCPHRGAVQLQSPECALPGAKRHPKLHKLIPTGIRVCVSVRVCDSCPA